VSLAEIGHWKSVNGRAVERQELQAKLASFVPPEHDWKALFEQRSTYESDLARYRIELEKYRIWFSERETKQSRANELTLAVAPLSALQRRLSVALDYEQLLKTYTQQKARYDELTEQVSEKKAQAQNWTKVKDAMTILRGLVKQHLVPSLNKVASHLLSQMTGGQRQSIQVDEEFNVMVDGQALDTLSGSGKAVANLALRLGLGQVLTNNVFSVFMGDEIDASLDADRAETTASTLRRLTSRILQIVLVTHKYTPADYCIALGGDGDQGQPPA
jgi:DNA repair exonuclease SbcCD ATPase subunit